MDVTGAMAVQKTKIPYEVAIHYSALLDCTRPRVTNLVAAAITVLPKIRNIIDRRIARNPARDLNILIINVIMRRWILAHVGSIDLLIDKQELIRNKVLEASSLCGSDTMDVSVRRQFEGKIFGLGYMFEHPSYQKRYDLSFYQWRGDLGVCPIPEPSTIGFLGLGELVVLGSKKYKNDKKKS